MSDANAAAAANTQPFTAEVSRLLHLMVHSVYSNRDIFLRELISNAADACERLRLMALDRPELAAGGDFRIKLSTDATKRTLIVEDNGIGMDRAALIDNLGTIARSGTRAFLEAGAKDGTALIGQFGVGFYSAFMVADRVEVFSRPAGANEAWRWASDGKGAFTVEAVDPALAPQRGTRVVLHLNAESKDYTSPDMIERIVAEHSAHVPVPIVLEVGDGAATRSLGDGSALWRKPKSEVDAKAYAEFYHHVGGQFDEPAITLHFRAEGRTEYSALLFIPSSKPFDLFDPERKSPVKLYVRRVFITDDAAILPPWLRFVRGVVDSEDLPLNLSREMLQKNPVLAQIGKGVTSRLLSEIERTAKDDSATFAKVWDAFGPVLKEGLYEDPDRRDTLFAISRFRSSSSGDGWRTLPEYVAAMKPKQTAIYYALGDSRENIAGSPHLEGFRKRGIEVLFLSDPVDAFWVRTALGFEGKRFQSITQGTADLTAIPVEDAQAETSAASTASVATLAARIKQALGDKVTAVRGSDRLTDSAVCLVASEAGPDRQLERLLSQHQGAPKRQAPVLEINPSHPLIKALIARQAGGDSATIDNAAFVLFGQAQILDGEAPADAADFGRRVSKLLEASLG